MTFKNKLQVLSVIVVLIMLQSCTAKVYAPVSHHVPLLEEEGDLSTAFYTSTTGFNLQGAYALTDKMGIGATLNYLYDQSENMYDNEEVFQKHRYAQLSFIYSLKPFRFSPTAERLFSRQPVRDRYIKVDFLGSIGLGSGEQDTYNEYAKGNYTKFSAQANIAFIYESFFIGVSPKLSYVSYYDYTYRNNSVDPMPGSPKNYDLNTIFWESAIFGGAQIGNIRLMLQYGGTRALGDEPSFNYGRSYLSLGLQVNFDV